MKFKQYIKSLEKRKIISRSPNPIIPFILVAISYLLSILTENISKFFSTSFRAIAIFTLIFAIIHLIVYKILTSR